MRHLLVSLATRCPPCHPDLPQRPHISRPWPAAGPIWRPPAPNQVVRSLDVFSGAPADLTDMLLVHARLTGGQAGGRGAAGRDCALPCVERLFWVALQMVIVIAAGRLPKAIWQA